MHFTAKLIIAFIVIAIVVVIAVKVIVAIVISFISDIILDLFLIAFSDLPFAFSGFLFFLTPAFPLLPFVISFISSPFCLIVLASISPYFSSPPTLFIILPIPLIPFAVTIVSALIFAFLPHHPSVSLTISLNPHQYYPVRINHHPFS